MDIYLNSIDINLRHTVRLINERKPVGLYAVSCGTQQSHFPGRERSDAPTGCLSLNVRTRAMAMKVDARERSIGGFSWRGKECIAWTTALWTCGQAQMQPAHMPTGLDHDQRL